MQTWIEEANTDDSVILVGFDPALAEELLKLEGCSAYLHEDAVAAIEVSAQRTRAFQAQRDKEHRELLLILQEALIDVAERDSDLASKLAARAYINLKTDPTGQRRYDGLLHRFTGVLHRASKKEQ